MNINKFDLIENMIKYDSKNSYLSYAVNFSSNVLLTYDSDFKISIQHRLLLISNARNKIYEIISQSDIVLLGLVMILSQVAEK